ncbi:MAG: hypothetical protein HYZ81_17465 [Nitrospinae bacterium]|nr:hypothetical protein [Candidatus Rokubacteria bacterium]MBI3328477.1 hypothetical protein [Nitrospinota bacterium]
MLKGRRTEIDYPNGYVAAQGRRVGVHADWGCKDGEHKAWIVVEVDSRDEARAIVPPAFRSQAKVVQLNAFTMEEIEDFLRQYNP